MDAEKIQTTGKSAKINMTIAKPMRKTSASRFLRRIEPTEVVNRPLLLDIFTPLFQHVGKTELECRDHKQNHEDHHRDRRGVAIVRTAG